MPSDVPPIQCPYCAEMVQADAIVCRFCNRGLSRRVYRPCPYCGESVLKSATICRYCRCAIQATGDTGGEHSKKRDKLRGMMDPSNAQKPPFDVRAQVFEVIVRQALAGVPWREICAGPMQVNNITPEEVEEEVQRRRLSGRRPPVVPNTVPAVLPVANKTDVANVDALLDKLNDALASIKQLQEQLQSSEHERAQLQEMVADLQARLLELEESP